MSTYSAYSPEFLACVIPMIDGPERGYLSAEEALRQGDPGGETNCGICKKSYPDLDIKALTRKDIIELYWRDYWRKCGADIVPKEMAGTLFDIAVNSGVSGATKLLQKAIGMVGEAVDGHLGPRTIETLLRMNVYRLVARFQGQRLIMMTQAKNWDVNSEGWALRVGRALAAL